MPSASAPSDLRCELLRHPEQVPLAVAQPAFSWVVNDTGEDAMQTAYEIEVGSGEELVWDSGKHESAASVAVPYSGPALPLGAACQWRVRTWNQHGEESPWSDWQVFRTAAEVRPYRAVGEPVIQQEAAPVRVVRRADGVDFVDFGKAMFGTVVLRLKGPVAPGEVRVALGECLAGENTVERQPKGTIRFREMTVTVQPGRSEYRVVIPSEKRNTTCPPAVPMPAGIGEVLPFRYAEITGLSRPLRPSEIVRLDTLYPFVDDASEFVSSSSALDQVWDLCKHSIKATSVTGIYIDGDRERIAYEADAFINQLAHYAVDAEYAMARVSHEFLITRPTWPTEWILHSVLIAWADFEYTGDDRSLRACYADLQAKTLCALAREDGLISVETGLLTQEVLDSVYIDRPLKDIVDWPPGSFTQGGQGERDGHDMRPINTVVNAFHYQALALMAKIAEQIGREEDALAYRFRAQRVAQAINTLLFDPAKGVYVDGEGSDHASLHANLFPLLFGLVPEERVAGVVAFAKSRGMACSVYGSHHLLEALYLHGEAEYALSLMTAEHDRGWLNMIRAGSTVALEAWDWKYKNNLDWNHAWGAAPASVIPRWLVGVRPLEPGFARILVAPQPGPLADLTARVPTIRGPVLVEYHADPAGYDLAVDLPANTQTLLRFPPGPAGSSLEVMDSTVDPAVGAQLGAGAHRFRVEYR